MEKIFDNNCKLVFSMTKTFLVDTVRERVDDGNSSEKKSGPADSDEEE